MASRHRLSPGLGRTAPAMRAGLIALSIAALATVTVILIDSSKPAPAPRGFPLREVEEANRMVLPFRQSGLIYHWADDSPAVYVRRAMWEELSEEAKRDLGRSIALAKNREQITILDESLHVRLAICTAKNGCTPVSIEPASALRGE